VLREPGCSHIIISETIKKLASTYTPETYLGVDGTFPVISYEHV